MLQEFLGPLFTELDVGFSVEMLLLPLKIITPRTFHVLVEPCMRPHPTIEGTPTMQRSPN